MWHLAQNLPHAMHAATKKKKRKKKKKEKGKVERSSFAAQQVKDSAFSQLQLWLLWWNGFDPWPGISTYCGKDWKKKKKKILLCCREFLLWLSAVPVRMQVQSLAPLSGWKVQLFHTVQHRLQMWLRSLLPWLWHRPVAATLIWLLARVHPYTMAWLEKQTKV